MSKEALYYPNIEFHDETWLKGSLCIWDKIYRIVPVSYKPNDSDEVKKLTDNGLVENINLSRSDLDETATLFEEYFENANVIPVGRIGSENQNVGLHPEKVNDRILPKLESLSKNVTSDGFLSLPKNLVDLYMFFLADRVSNNRNINKLTNDNDFFTIMHYFANDANFDELGYREDGSEVTASLVLESVIPKYVHSMSVQDLLKFRKDTNDGRLRFRNSIEKLIEELTQIEDINFQRARIVEYLNTLEKNRKELRKQAGIDLTRSFVTIGLQTTLSAIGLLTGFVEPLSIKVISEACAFGVVSALANNGLAKRHRWRNSDSHYYHQLVKSSTSIKDLLIGKPPPSKIFHEFIND